MNPPPPPPPPPGMHDMGPSLRPGGDQGAPPRPRQIGGHPQQHSPLHLTNQLMPRLGQQIPGMADYEFEPRSSPLADRAQFGLNQAMNFRPTYEGMVFEKQRPRERNQIMEWDEVIRRPMPLASEDLELRVQRRNATRNRNVLDDYEALRLDLQREHIDRWRAEKIAAEEHPYAAWNLASVETERRSRVITDARGRRKSVQETVAIRVTLKRELDRARVPRHGPVNGREIVNVRDSIGQAFTQPIGRNHMTGFASMVGGPQMMPGQQMHTGQRIHSNQNMHPGQQMRPDQQTQSGPPMQPGPQMHNNRQMQRDPHMDTRLQFQPARQAQPAGPSMNGPCGPPPPPPPPPGGLPVMGHPPMPNPGDARMGIPPPKPQKKSNNSIKIKPIGPGRLPDDSDSDDQESIVGYIDDLDVNDRPSRRNNKRDRRSPPRARYVPDRPPMGQYSTPRTGLARRPSSGEDSRLKKEVITTERIYSSDSDNDHYASGSSEHSYRTRRSLTPLSSLDSDSNRSGFSMKANHRGSLHHREHQKPSPQLGYRHVERQYAPMERRRSDEWYGYPPTIMGVPTARRPLSDTSYDTMTRYTGSPSPRGRYIEAGPHRGEYLDDY
ncbi:hypothetical protein LTS18_007029, partial [Coniosporium uncinatum]